jgi:hypothetical protein
VPRGSNRGDRDDRGMGGWWMRSRVSGLTIPDVAASSSWSCPRWTLFVVTTSSTTGGGDAARIAARSTSRRDLIIAHRGRAFGVRASRAA